MKVRSGLSVYIVLFVLLALSGNLFSKTPFKILKFTPTGEAKNIRQVVVEFSDAVIPFGQDATGISPFNIDCSEKGNGHWIDEKAWVYDFERDMPAGVACQFQLRQDIKSLAGESYQGDTTFSFSTGGPVIIDSNPYEGSGIEEDSAFVLKTDGELDLSSVLKNVYFVVDGIENRVNIKLIEGDLRNKLIKQFYQYRDKPSPEELKRVVALQATLKFPSSGMVKLVWGAGVSSKSGVATKKDYVQVYRIRTPFKVEFNCARENPKAQCSPLQGISLGFNTPISRDQAVKVLLQLVPDKKDKKDKNIGKRIWKPSIGVRESEIYSVEFKAPFPEKSSFVLNVPKNLTDVDGRPLKNQGKFPLKFKTDEYPPLVKFSSDFGILEAKADPALPVTIRNIEDSISSSVYGMNKNSESSGLKEKVSDFVVSMKTRFLRIPRSDINKVMAWMHKISVKRRDASIFAEREKDKPFEKLASLTLPDGKVKEMSMPHLNGTKDAEVVGIPLQEPGFYVVEIKSQILGKKLLGADKPMYVASTALVTNLAVHFKAGKENSLAWVTSLDKGEPVSGALVSVWDCEGKTYWKGATNKDGYVVMDTELPSDYNAPTCTEGYESPYMRGLMVVAEYGSDFSFVHSSWDEGIASWRFNIPQIYGDKKIVAHTVFDRSLFRAGERVHMKHVIREKSLRGFKSVKKDMLPEIILINHVGSDQEYEFPLKWRDNGTAETEWDIPKDAKLGKYWVTLTNKKREFKRRLNSGDFSVEEFKVPLTKAFIKMTGNEQGAAIINPESLSFDVGVQYFNGGSAGGLSTKFRHFTSKRHSVGFPDFENFVFARGAYKKRSDSDDSDVSDEKKAHLVTDSVVLDINGGARVVAKDITRASYPQQLTTELEYKDPNGEMQTVTQVFSLWPAQTLIGIRLKTPYASVRENPELELVVVNPNGKPVKGVEVMVNATKEEYFSHRKKLVGGFYSYEHETKLTPLGLYCKGVSDEWGRIDCKGKLDVTGNVIFQASSKDKKGFTSITYTDVYIYGRDSQWVMSEDSDRIDLIPDKKQYNPGDVAKFQVKMPFQEANVLVTAEREGVSKAYLVHLKSKESIFELPIEPFFAPNIYISALAVRGRVDDPKPTSVVDLARPSFKLGLVMLKVGHAEHELKVEVTPDKKVYNVREQAKVKIKVKSTDDKPLPKGGEVTVAVVDEGLLALLDNNSWDLLSAMMGQRPYDVKTYTASTQVIGKRHFGLKALPEGGGGGYAETARTLFNTLVFWKATVPLNKNGEAEVDFKLNDSLTSFKIATVALAGENKYGVGFSSISSKQDIMTFAGVPEVVREGDLVKSVFTIRNSSTEKKELILDLSTSLKALTLQKETITLNAGESREMSWDIKVPDNISGIDYDLKVNEGASVLDEIKVTQKVIPVVTVHSYQASLFRLSEKKEVPVAMPEGAAPNKGGIQVGLASSLLKNMKPVEDYMRDYPFRCLEQRFSRAVSLGDINEWKNVEKEIPMYMDGNGFLKYFPSSRDGSVTLTSYVLVLVAESGWPLGEKVKTKMMEGLEGFIQGKISSTEGWLRADLTLRKLQALDALTRHKKVAVEMLGTIHETPEIWPTSAVIDWWNTIRRTDNVPSKQGRLDDLEKIIRTRMTYRGMQFSFSTDESDNLSWLMVSPEVNANRLILSLLEFGLWKNEIGKVVNGVVRKTEKYGHYGLTTANALGMLALKKFADVYEKDKVKGKTTVSTASDSKIFDWGVKETGDIKLLKPPAKKEILSLKHEGDGDPWVSLVSLAAVTIKQPEFRGYQIKKKIVPIEQKKPGEWHVGDIYRVVIQFDAQTDMTMVALNDPVPPGAAILGGGLGRDSAAVQMKSSGSGQTNYSNYLAFEERTKYAYRAYYDYLSKGVGEIDYVIRLNTAGSFTLPTTRIEALYEPDSFGEIPNALVKVMP